MSSLYPGGLDNFPTNRVNATPMINTHPDDHDNLADAVNKIEAELGIDPAGGYATVVARLDAGIPAPGMVRLIDLGIRTPADLSAGPFLLYTPSVGEVVIAGYVIAEDTVPVDTGTLVVGFGSPVRYLLAAIDPTSPWDTGMMYAGLDKPMPIYGVPVYLSVATNPDDLLCAAWSASAPYGNDAADDGLFEEGTIWTNTGNPGTTGVAQPDFAGNVGGSVADGPDIVWTDGGPGLVPTSGALHALIQVAIPVAA